jgi:TPR repeat protein
MKLITTFLLVGMFAVSGLAQIIMPEPYSPELVQRAEAGDAVAQWSLGRCYVDGRSLKMNKEVSFGWFIKSAEQGNAEAQYELSEYYRGELSQVWKTNGARIEELIKMREGCLLKAAEGGCLRAQKTIAHEYLFSNSKGAARIEDLEEAKKWYTKLAENGCKDDVKMIGQCDEAIKKEQRLLKTTKSK